MSVLRISTTDGRQRLPDLIQSVFGGEIDVVIFERYGRPLAALVPLKALSNPADFQPERTEPPPPYLGPIVL